jgi:hypothetical protein
MKEDQNECLCEFQENSIKGLNETKQCRTWKKELDKDIGILKKNQI